MTSQESQQLAAELQPTLCSICNRREAWHHRVGFVTEALTLAHICLCTPCFLGYVLGDYTRLNEEGAAIVQRISAEQQRRMAAMKSGSYATTGA